MSSDLARNAYQQIEANGSNSAQLVVLLYDGAIRFLGEAKSCAESGDRRGKAAAISRTLSILAELQSTLKSRRGAKSRSRSTACTPTLPKKFSTPI